MRPSLSQIYRGTVTTAYLGRALTPYVLEDADKLALRSDVVFVIMQGYSDFTENHCGTHTKSVEHGGSTMIQREWSTRTRSSLLPI